MSRERAAAFVEEHLKIIFAYALSRVSDKEDAEDLTNDIVLAILRSADKLKDHNAFYGYVWGIAANTYRKFLRKRRRYRTEELEETIHDANDFVDDIVLRDDIVRLRREIALLSKEYRECTVAYYFDGLSCAQIAQTYHLSLEMVKYYLFKTRKILKEGISMEREFGERSFKPSPFEFRTIFDGMFNPEYRQLFARKLPGQILSAAYYTPLSVRELAVELGVASIYLEDEIATLEKYHLLQKTPRGKYQTDLVIFTEAYHSAFYHEAETFTVPAWEAILSGVKNKLSMIKKINASCEALPDDRVLWGVLWPLLKKGYGAFKSTHEQYDRVTDMLYNGATGTNYGVIEEGERNPLFKCSAFAGFSALDQRYAVVAADFGVLPDRNRYFATVGLDDFRKQVYGALAGDNAPPCMILKKEEETALFALLEKETAQVATLYEKLFACAISLMHTHAPQSVQDKVDRIVFHVLLFDTVGFLGGCAFRSGMMTIPDHDGPLALYVYER